MNYSSYRFTLDIHSTQSQVSIPVKLGDTARELYITLADGALPYVISDGSRAVFSAVKADGSRLLNDCIILNNAKVYYQFTDKTANYPGITNCEILLYGKDGRLISSPHFIMVVDDRVNYDYDELAGDEKTTIDNIISAEQERVQAEEARVSAEVNRASAEEARADAEAERVSAEAERASAEEARADAEAGRADIYEALKSVDESATPLSVAKRDDNGYMDVLTPDIQWGCELTDEEKNKAVNAGAADALAHVIVESCDTNALAFIEVAEKRILEQTVTHGALDDVLAKALAGKLDKMVPDVAQQAVYFATKSGEQSTQPMVYNKATAWSVAQRDGSGVLFVGTPTADGHAATKKYVADAIAALRAELTGS